MPLQALDERQPAGGPQVLVSARIGHWQGIAAIFER
jgi:hypothetical protein